MSAADPLFYFGQITDAARRRNGKGVIPVAILPDRLHMEIETHAYPQTAIFTSLLHCDVACMKTDVGRSPCH